MKVQKTLTWCLDITSVAAAVITSFTITGT